MRHTILGAMSLQGCYGKYHAGKPICSFCPDSEACSAESPTPEDLLTAAVPALVKGTLDVEQFDLALTLYSGQTFRWGRDTDGWWKGVAYGVVVWLRQEERQLRYACSAASVSTYAGSFEIESFLRWYLRTDEPPRVRVPRPDRHLRRARDRMKGFRFVRQEPWECIISYILSVQAHMGLTKQRIQFLSRILGREVVFQGGRYWTFPPVDQLALLSEGYYRHQKFGWRSKFLPTSIQYVQEVVQSRFSGGASRLGLEDWRAVVDGLLDTPNSGIGLKVAKCIDLFSLDRLFAVPVDTWVRKMAADWYGVEATDAKICQWAEERGGKLAGYKNEYLFAYYRELHAPSLDDRVISFSQSDAPSSVLPYEILES